MSKTRKNKSIKNRTKKNKMKKVALHIFNSDLSIYDNTSLNHLASIGAAIIPIFIFTDEQVRKSVVFNSHSLQFLYESLKELNEDIVKRKGELHFFHGKTEKVLDDIIDSLLHKEIRIIVSKNDDYSEYAIKRDNNIRELCIKKGVEFIKHDHKSLCELDKTKKDDGTFYSKFTPFYNKATRLPVKKTKTNVMGINIGLKNGKNIEIKTPNLSNKYEYLTDFIAKNTNMRMKGGRKEGLRLLNSLKQLKTYQKTRDILSKETSGLSAHHKFGTITIRETYEAAKKAFGTKNGFVRQLYWRDFYYTVALKFSQDYKQSVYTWQSRNKSIGNEKHFIAWKEGRTGFPIVDAGMRELNQTGFMHNRARMITASVLIKTLLVNWRKGERYFAEKLGDYDFCMNFGNWCWVAGNMPHSQPPFRIMSPWSQANRFDPNCEYIKKWVPELKDVPNEHILQWDEYAKQYKQIDYPKPIVDYKENRNKWASNYRTLLK